MENPGVCLTDFDGRSWRLFCRRCDSLPNPSLVYFFRLTDFGVTSVVISDTCFSVSIERDFVTVNIGMSYITFPVSELPTIEAFQADLAHFLVAA